MPSDDSVEVTLRDGSAVAIRPIASGDEPLLAALYGRLSPESRRRRFLVAPERLADEDLHRLVDVDHRRHDALLALEAASGEPVGEARYVRVPGDRETAEVAAMVADDWQRRGVATALLTELTDRARAHGLRRYSAIVSADNLPVLDALERQGARRHGDDDQEVELTIEFPPEGLPQRLGAALRWAAGGELRLLGALARRIAEWSASTRD